MKRVWFLAVAVALAVGAESRAEKKVSKTFAEILTRVLERDTDSGAIVAVKMKEDAPPYAMGRLDFEMREGPQEGAVTIRLMTPSLTRSVYEQYVLVIDDKIREELDNLELMRKQTAEKQKKWREEQTEKIRKLTGGKLKFGMSEAEVVKVLGEPVKRHTGSMEAGVFSLEYPDWLLEFRVGLIDVKPIKK